MLQFQPDSMFQRLLFSLKAHLPQLFPLVHFKVAHMEAGCQGIAGVPIMISRVASLWSQDDCSLGLTSACYSEAVPLVWFWFRRKAVCKPNKQARAEYLNDQKQNSFETLEEYQQFSSFNVSQGSLLKSMSSGQRYSWWLCV